MIVSTGTICALMLMLFISHGKLINSHESYLAGVTVTDTVRNIQGVQLWGNYLDTAGERAMIHTLYDYDNLQLTPLNCLDGSAIRVIPGCSPNFDIFQNSLILSFEARLKEYISLLDEVEFELLGKDLEKPSFPTEFEYYIFDDRLYGVPYEDMTFVDNSITVMSHPSFSVKLQYPIFDWISGAYKEAEALDLFCKGEPSYITCLNDNISNEDDRAYVTYGKVRITTKHNITSFAKSVFGGYTPKEEPISLIVAFE